MTQRLPIVAAGAGVLAASLFLAACGGGGGSSAPSAPAAVVTTAPPATTAPQSTQQVVSLSDPATSSIGTVSDPIFGEIGGFTQSTYSQVLAFAPGAQIMIRNAQTTVALPHTMNVLSQSAFPAIGAALTTSAAGGTTLAAGFASGTINPAGQVGPITLTSGTYFIGCAFHYNNGPTNSMRTVLVVAASATPGPQATPPAGQATPNSLPSGSGSGPIY